MEMKLNISDPKNGKTYKRVLTEEKAEPLYNKKIGDKINGDTIGFEGYEFEITGGSDFCGFPMRKDIEGTVRKKILSTKSTGIKAKRKGIRVRKTVAGNTIYEKTTQVNMKILKKGKESLEPKEEKKDDKKEEKKE